MATPLDNAIFGIDYAGAPIRVIPCDEITQETATLQERLVNLKMNPNANSDVAEAMRRVNIGAKTNIRPISSSTQLGAARSEDVRTMQTGYGTFEVLIPRVGHGPEWIHILTAENNSPVEQMSTFTALITIDVPDITTRVINIARRQAELLQTMGRLAEREVKYAALGIVNALLTTIVGF